MSRNAVETAFEILPFWREPRISRSDLEIVTTGCGNQGLKRVSHPQDVAHNRSEHLFGLLVVTLDESVDQWHQNLLAQRTKFFLCHRVLMMRERHLRAYARKYRRQRWHALRLVPTSPHPQAWHRQIR